MIGFGKFGKRKLEFLSLKDERLVKVDTSEEGFYEIVLSCTATDENIREFCNAILEVKEVNVKPFYRPIMDPSLCDNEVIYLRGKMPAVGYSFNWWKNAVKKMPAVEGRQWSIGTEYQYYAFLVFLINNLVKAGWDIDCAIKAIVKNSNDLGHYCNSSKLAFEDTGSRENCGIYDLANTFKILACTNEDGEFWIASGAYICSADVCTLANIFKSREKNEEILSGVAWLVL